MTIVILGRGSLGSSYGVAMECGLIVSMKRLNNCNTINQGQVDRHMEMLGNMRHPLKAYFRAFGCSGLLSQWQPLLSHSRSWSRYTIMGRGREGEALHWTSCLKIVEDIGQGVAYLYTMGVTHGNLKSSNVVISCDFEAHITDYGLSFFGNHGDNGSASIATSACPYMAPEYKYNTHNMTCMVDVYSFSVILLKILSGKPLTHVVMNMRDLPRWVMSVREEIQLEEREKDEVQLFLNIVMACMSPSPELQPSMRDGVRMITKGNVQIVTVSAILPLHLPLIATE